ncbi:2-hydroxyhepta-2,4-diene-1,7-dioate isomerase [Hypericibacter adhaerens]|jgi:2-keto-4-pentenoate hydratase/2-oxohepta-3-ene-1,7-dioic acid hydratase in catechol pathway|uniref:2-hydroxyhepta-2,4-diene-1,7-dioate isomerase n=1 Tax=Hypericibacter adhaerens TaxID=2602016 RepID=A0A5J6MWT0_9PROT|nr:fumarylacetoacetate hydrolase family protein [Hypericibacter adhaerens]QEX21165.1 2-hydroxyhepta-2,4-diene-1,7-dioate isomerase [Hypericibacter adhaerens]
MKLVNFWRDGDVRLGFMLGEEILEPGLAGSLLGPGEARLIADTVSFIGSGEAGLRLASRLIQQAPATARHALASVRLAPPLRPSTILCTGSNYSDHNQEKANAPTSGKEPEFFIKTSDCVAGPGESIQYDPSLTRKLDCETELAIVMGKPGRHIPRERALEHVFGYTIVNDVTARDRQVRRSNGVTWYDLGRGKAFDTSAPIGPWIVTADEIGDPQALRLQTRINGELRQSSNTSNMIWSCADLIHFFSVNFTLKPGMVIITGTPAGTAWSADEELGGRGQIVEGLVAATRYCLPGDVIECEVESIGVLRSNIVELRI